MHRVGGLEKEDGTGNINYTPENHEQMVHLRAAKIAGIADDIPPRRGASATPTPTLCIARLGLDVGRDRRRRAAPPPATAARWPGSTSPTSTRCRPNLGEVLRRFPKVLVPELNIGQLCRIVRAEYLVDAQSVTKVAGPAVHRRRDREPRIEEALGT